MVTLPVTIGDAPGDAGPTVTLPETVPGGGGGEPACGAGCSKAKDLFRHDAAEICAARLVLSLRC